MIDGDGHPDYAVANAMAETDDEHIAYMLDGGTRGMIERLVETEDTWGFGGSLWISKTYAHYEAGALGASSGRIYALGEHTRFEKAWFELDTGAKGWAVWFHAPELPLRGRMLCGWVPADRESDITSWLAFLNAEIEARVREGRRLPVRAAAASSDERFKASIEAFRRLGVPMPQADNIDAFVARLEEAAADGPLDARTPTLGQAAAGDAWLSIQLGSAYGPNGWIGADRFSISSNGQIDFNNQRGDRNRRVVARLAPALLQQLQAAVVESVFANPPPLGPLVPDATVVTLGLTSASGQRRTIEIEYYKALAAPDLGPLIGLLDRVANHLRDPASRAPDANLAAIVEEDAEWS